MRSLCSISIVHGHGQGHRQAYSVVYTIARTCNLPSSLMSISFISIIIFRWLPLLHGGGQEGGMRAGMSERET